MTVGAALERLLARYGPEPPSRADDPWRVLVATVLSARTRDEVTAPAAARLLEAHPTPQALAEASEADVLEHIATVGLRTQKARNLVRLAQRVVAEHGGQVPSDRDALEALPGVGPKTAACVLCYAFAAPVVAVDTHVHRLANTLGWVETDSPEATEAALTPRVAAERRSLVNELLVRFGREVCRPRAPQCAACCLNDLCPAATKPARVPMAATEGPTMLARFARGEA